MPKYCISGLILDIKAPEWVLHGYFADFSCDLTDTDVHCSIVFEPCPRLPAEQACLIVKASGKSIYSVGTRIHMEMGDSVPSCIVASADWSECVLYVDPSYRDPVDADTRRYVIIGLYYALRDMVIAALAQRNGLLVHSCSIVWNGKGVLFSAPSGTGKSTHVSLWKQLYGVQVLDGDVTACRLIDGGFAAFGLPWCGTSGEFLNRCVPLGAVVFLQQGQKNSIKRLSREEAFLRLAARCFMPRWSSELMELALGTVQRIAEGTDCYLLNCLPDFEAVELVKDCLEKR